MSRYDFKPIAEAPTKGSPSLVLADDTGWQAVGHRCGDFWALGHAGQPSVIEQLDFEPTKFALPKKARPAPETPTPADAARSAHRDSSNVTNPGLYSASNRPHGEV